MYQRNRRVWWQQWKERGWKVFWELKVGASAELGRMVEGGRERKE